MPAGAIPIPFRPNCTTKGLETLAPSFGLMMYTSAPAGAGVRSWAQTTVAASTSAAVTANIRMVELSVNQGLDGQGGGRAPELNIRLAMPLAGTCWLWATARGSDGINAIHGCHHVHERPTDQIRKEQHDELRKRQPAPLSV